MLKAIHIENIRNISKAAIYPSPVLNVFIGENGSGKSTLLEAINLLSTGRSFRTVDLSSLISFEQSGLLARCVVINKSDIDTDITKTNVGFSFSRNKEKLVKINGDRIGNSSELAQCLPLKFLSPLEGELIEGAPGLRRKYVDWLMFHVEHPVYLEKLKSFKVVLSNRNATLKKKDRAQEPYWRNQFISLAEELAELTSVVFEEFKSFINREVTKILKTDAIEFVYFRGWKNGSELSQILEDNIENDFRIGTTRYGYQRSDLRILVDNKSAADVLSRGQMKLCAMALQLAQIKYLKQEKNVQCVVLIDDVIAELDDLNVCAVIEEFIDSNSQCFVTSANKKLADLLGTKFSDFYKLFHVEHGTIIEEE